MDVAALDYRGGIVAVAVSAQAAVGEMTHEAVGAGGGVVRADARRRGSPGRPPSDWRLAPAKGRGSDGRHHGSGSGQLLRATAKRRQGAAA